MPGLDGTGPFGQGPQTGGGLGYCTGYTIPGYTSYGRPMASRGFGRRFGRGFGRGFRGRRAHIPAHARGYGPTYAPAYGPYRHLPSKEEQAELLRERASMFERSLTEIKKRLEELKRE